MLANINTFAYFLFQKVNQKLHMSIFFQLIYERENIDTNIVDRSLHGKIKIDHE